MPAASANFLDFKYDAPPHPAARPSHETVVLLQAQELYDDGKYRQAADILDGPAATDDLARRLLLDCLVQLRDMAKIAERFDPPVSPIEAIYLKEARQAKTGRQGCLAKIVRVRPLSEQTQHS